nr:PREDICTED: uncharacterized protein LOC109035085 isoform X1 [Bemisia tabaci]
MAISSHNVNSFSRSLNRFVLQLVTSLLVATVFNSCETQGWLDLQESSVENESQNTVPLKPLVPLNTFNHFMLSVKADNSSTAGNSSTSGTNSTEKPYEIPLAGLLVLARFDEFKAQLEDALKAFIAAGNDASTKLHYEVFVFASFYPISKIYSCVPIGGESEKRVCEHILMPNPEGGAISAFVIKYLLAPSEDKLQATADEGLKQMLAHRIDGTLLKNNMHVQFVHSLCLSFHKTSVGLAHKKEVKDEIKF